MSLNRHNSTRRRKPKKNNRRRQAKLQDMEYQTLEERRLLAVDIGVSVTSTTFGRAGLGDLTGAVGPAHIVEVVDDVINVYDKQGNFQESKPLDQFWTDTGGLGAQSSMQMVQTTRDARVVYDVDERRWFITATSDADIITGIQGTQAPTLVAVSRTSNPLQDWQSLLNFYDVDDNPDTPSVAYRGGFLSAGARTLSTNLSVDDHNIYVTVSEASPFVPAQTWAFNKFEDLVVPTPNSFNPSAYFVPTSTLQWGMDVGGTTTGAFGLYVPGSGSEIFLTELSSPEVAGGAVLEPDVSIPVDAYLPPPPFVRQEFDPDIVNSGASLTAATVRLDNSLWAAHAILGASGETSAIRWYEIDLDTNSVKQSGTIQDDVDNYIYPSIAVSPAGHIVIGHTSTGIGRFPSASVSVGYNVNGSIVMEDPVQIKDGEGGYFDGQGNFWGRYLSTVADPEDPSKVWVFGQWSDDSDDGQTQIAEINLVGYSATVNATADDNVIVVRRSALIPEELEVEIDGIVVAAFEEANIYSITVDGMGGNDTFILDTVNGELDLPYGVEFIGDGDDAIQLDSTEDSNWEVERDGAGMVIVGTDQDPTCVDHTEDVVTFVLNFEEGSGWFDSTPWNQDGYATFGDALRGNLQEYFDEVIAPVFAGTFTVTLDINDDELDSIASAQALGYEFQDYNGNQVWVASPWSILNGRGDTNGPDVSDGIIDYNLDPSLYGGDLQAMLDNIAGGWTRHEFFHILGMENQIPVETTTNNPRGGRNIAGVYDLYMRDINGDPLLGNFDPSDNTYEVLNYAVNSNWAGDNAGVYFVGESDSGTEMQLLVNSNTEQIDFRHLASSFLGTGRDGPWDEIIEQDRAFLRGMGYSLNPVTPPIPDDGNAVFFSGVDEVIGGTGVDHFCIRSVNVDLTVEGNIGNDIFVVTGVGIGALNLFGQDGDDYYEVNTSAASVITIGDSVGSENDKMLVLGTSGNDLFVFEPTGVEINAGRLLYSGIEDINFDARDGDDVFEIQAANVGTAKLDGGLGDDSFLVNDQGAGANANQLTISKVDPASDQLQLDIETYITDTYLAEMIENYSVDGTYVIDGVNGTPTVAGGINLLGDGDEHLVIESSVDAQWIIDGDGSGNVTMDVEPLTFMGVEEIDASHGADTFDIQMTNTDLLIRGREADDNISVNNSGTGFVSFGGNIGNDTLEVLNSGGGVLLVGQEGMDTFTIDDSGTGMSTLLGGFDADTFNVLNSGSAGLTIDGNEGMDVFNIDNPAGTAPTVVEGGSGNDQFNVLDAGLGDLELRGEVGDDNYFVEFVDPATTFSIIDSVNAENDTLTVLGTSGDDVFDVTDGTAIINGGTWTIIGIESFDYDGQGGNDIFNVDLPDSWDGTMTLTGSDGNDQFIVTGTGMGPISLQGQEGDDYYEVHFNPNTDVTIFDDGVGDADSFKGLATDGNDQLDLTMTTANINGGMLAITGVETVEYDALDGEDEFNVDSAIGQSTFVGSGGADTFNVSSTTDSNHYLGNAGDDIFNILDSSGIATFEGGIGADTFNVTMTSGNGTYSGDAGDDVFNIESATGDSTFLGGDDEDLFNITDHLTLGSTGSINIDAGAARNVMVVNGYQMDSNNVIVTNATITGMSAVPINYSSTGGSFSIDGVTGGIQLLGSDSEVNNFDVRSFGDSDSLLMRGGSAEDFFTVRALALGVIEAAGLEGGDTYQFAVGTDSGRVLFALDTGTTGTDRLVNTMTEGADEVMLSGEVFTVGTDTMVFNDQLEAMIIDTRGGDDQVSIAQMDVGFLRLITGAGNDTVDVNQFNGIQNGIMLNTGDDNDTINLITSSSGSFLRASGDAGDDTINVSSNSYGNAIVDGNEGSDVYTVNIADRSARFTVARDSGVDGIDVLNVNGTVLDDFLLFRSGLVSTTAQKILYNETTEVLNVETGIGRDNMSIFGISAAETNIDTGPDRDLFQVTSTFGNQPAKVLNASLGLGDDSAVVRGSNEDTTITISGNAGDDYFNIGSSLVENNGNLDLIQGLVAINGDDGFNRIYMNDRGKISSADYFVDVGSVRDHSGNPDPFFAGIDYSSIDVFRLDATDYKNLIEVVGSEETKYLFYGNLGFNQLSVVPDDDGRQLFKTGDFDGFYTFENKRDIFFENFFIV